MINSFALTLVVGAFELHQEEIVESCCMQRAEQVNTCQGHCVLAKKLDATPQKDQIIDLGGISFSYFPVEVSSFSLSTISAEESKNLSGIYAHYHLTLIDTPDHPPRFS